jgi:hypothetical protein
MKSEIPKPKTQNPKPKTQNPGTQDQGHPSIAALKPSYAMVILKDPRASAANAADRASSIHQMKIKCRRAFK